MNGEDREWDELRRLALGVAHQQGAGPWAEDIASEVLLRLFVQADAVEDPRGWVAVAARNAAIDVHRRQPAGGWTDLPVSSPEPGRRLHPRELWVTGPSSGVARRDQLERVLAVLNEVERALLIGQSEGRSARELAQEYGYTERSVRVKLSVARRKIRERFPEMPALGFD